MKVTIVIVAWGEPYIRLLHDYALPSMLSEGNLPALAASHEVLVRLYTRPEDLPLFDADPSARTLRGMAKVEAVDIATLPPADLAFFGTWAAGKFLTMSACHLNALRRAWTEDSALIFLMPDNLFSEGSLGRIAQLMQEGKRCLMVSHLPVLETTFAPALEAAFPRSSAGVRTLAPERFARLSLAHRHPWSDHLFMDQNPFLVCSHQYWRVDGHGFVSHAWHRHPFYIHPRRPPSAFFHSIDNDYTCQVLDGPEDWCQPVDCRDVCCVEPLPPEADQQTRPQPYPYSPLRWALAAEGLFTSPHNFHWGRTGLSWCPDASEARRQAVLKEAQRSVERAQAWMAFLDPSLDIPPGASLEAEDLREAEALLGDLRREAERFECLGPPMPSPVYSWANLAKLHAALGNRSEALQALGHMIRLGGKNPHTLRRAQRLAARLGEPMFAEGAR